MSDNVSPQTLPTREQCRCISPLCGKTVQEHQSHAACRIESWEQTNTHEDCTKELTNLNSANISFVGLTQQPKLVKLADLKTLLSIRNHQLTSTSTEPKMRMPFVLCLAIREHIYQLTCNKPSLPSPNPNLLNRSSHPIRAGRWNHQLCMNSVNRQQLLAGNMHTTWRYHSVQSGGPKVLPWPCKRLETCYPCKATLVQKVLVYQSHLRREMNCTV